MPHPISTSNTVNEVAPTLPHPAWPALVNPHRFAEARKAIERDSVSLLAARGDKWGESAMHWVAMADPGSWLDLLAAGGDPNALDKTGRTPLDWINDRLWMGAMAPHQRLGAPSRDRIRVATIKQAPVVWASGGRSGVGKSSLNPVKLWIEAGLWDLLSLADDVPALWRDWEGGMHAFHAWSVMADRQGATELFERIVATGLPLDQPDQAGKTALWTSVDRWLADPAHASASRAAIETLRRHGADPDLDAGAGAPVHLPLRARASEQLRVLIFDAMGM